MQTSASVCILERTSSAMDETCRLRRGEDYEACEDEPPEAQLRYYRILPHAGACRQPLRQNLRFCHLPLHRGGFGRTESSAPTGAMQIFRRMRNTLPLAPQSIHSGSCAATSFIGRVVTIQAARSSMRKGDSRVLAAALNSGAFVVLRQAAPRVLAPLFSPFFSGKTEKNGPPEAQLRYYRILPHVGVCRQPRRQNLRFCHLPLHKGGFGAYSIPTTKQKQHLLPTIDYWVSYIH